MVKQNNNGRSVSGLSVCGHIAPDSTTKHQVGQIGATYKQDIMDNSNLHYTNVCWYCGAIYKSNRSTSKYCSKKHNSLFNAYGSRIKPIQDSSGNIVDYDRILEEVYSELEISDCSGWGANYSHRCVVDDFNYIGPLPTGMELLVVGSYMIKGFIGEAIDGSNIYCVKPFTELTLEEKGTARIIDGFQSSIFVPQDDQDRNLQIR